jgi:hypothetical protein
MNVGQMLQHDYVLQKLNEEAPWAVEHWEPAFAGDQEAAGYLIISAPNRFRGCIARLAYNLRLPNPAYREIVGTAWGHDPEAVMDAVKYNTGLARRMLARCEVRPKLSGPVRIYRGTSGISPRLAVRGLSWSLSADIAAWFAWRWQNVNGKPVVVAADVAAESLIYFDDGRGEMEVVPGCRPESWIEPFRPDQIRALHLYHQQEKHTENVSGWLEDQQRGAWQ